MPGLVEHGHDVWAFAGIAAAAQALADFDRGRIVVLVAGAPYPCPPAPYECALHVDEHLRSRGLREDTDLSVVTLQPMLMPNAGRAGSDADLQEREPGLAGVRGEGSRGEKRRQHGPARNPPEGAAAAGTGAAREATTGAACCCEAGFVSNAS